MKWDMRHQIAIWQIDRVAILELLTGAGVPRYTRTQPADPDLLAHTRPLIGSVYKAEQMPPCDEVVR